MPRNDRAVATALVALSSVVDESQLLALCDKALTLLSASGSGDIRSFIPTVVNVLEKSGQIVSAVLTTPTGSVPKERRDSIVTALEKKFGKPVLLTEKADTSLLGGARLRVGDDLYDCSLQGDLQKFSLL